MNDHRSQTPVTLGEAFAYYRWRVLRAQRFGLDSEVCECQQCTDICWERWRANERTF